MECTYGAANLADYGHSLCVGLLLRTLCALPGLGGVALALGGGLGTVSVRGKMREGRECERWLEGCVLTDVMW